MGTNVLNKTVTTMVCKILAKVKQSINQNGKQKLDKLVAKFLTKWEPKF